MADEQHIHLLRYTVHMQPRHWWQRLLGITPRLAIVGVGSSLQGGELLIKSEHGAFTSINYARVLWMDAEVIERKDG